MVMTKFRWWKKQCGRGSETVSGLAAPTTDVSYSSNAAYIYMTRPWKLKYYYQINYVVAYICTWILAKSPWMLEKSCMSTTPAFVWPQLLKSLCVQDNINTSHC